MEKIVRDLAKLHGPSGFEQPVIRYITSELEALTDEWSVDHLGNIIAIKKGSRPGPRLILTAHMDEVGFIIRSITPDGLLKVESLGGHDIRILAGQKVRVRTGTGYLIGVFGGISAHYRKFESESKLKSVRESYIDIGARSKKQAIDMGVAIGDSVTWLSDVTVLGNSDTGRLVGKGFDDRAGCAVLLQVLKDLPDFSGELVFIFTVQEEIGLRGAKVAAEGIVADAAIAIDTTAASDTPESVLDDELYIGGGVGIKVMDVSLIAHPAIREKLKTLAVEGGIPYQLEVFPGIGTDGGAVHLSNKGIPTGVLSIPSRNAHSPIEIIDITDLEAAKDLLTLFITNEDELLSFTSF